MGKPSQPSLFPSFRASAGGAPTPPAETMPLFDLPVVVRNPSGRHEIWRTEARKTMSEISNEFRAALDGGAEAVGLRWAQALRSRYPGAHQAKRIAADFRAEIRTAQSWLGGQAPQVKHLCRAALVHGPSIVTEVLLPGTSLDTEARVDRGLEELEQRLDALRAQLSALRGSDAS